MNLKLKKQNLTYRKLKITDYQQFNRLFFNCFKKNVSKSFFKSRYFDDKYSFCFGAFQSSRLIANVGMFSMKLNNNKNDRVFSRHSSMVLDKYRGKGIFSNLLKIVREKIINKVNIIIMWPNKNNFSNFGLDNKSIIKNKLYLYKSFSHILKTKKTKTYSIDKLFLFKNFAVNKKSFFIKNFKYFKKRYLKYQKNEYFINELKIKNDSSFFILKKNKEYSEFNYVILDHFGSQKIKEKHLSCLITEKNKLIFLSKKKIKKKNLNLINHIHFNIGFIRNFKLKNKKKFLGEREIFLGDTDIFITTKKVKNFF